jgi:hypothetical protein
MLLARKPERFEDGGVDDRVVARVLETEYLAGEHG